MYCKNFLDKYIYVHNYTFVNVLMLYVSLDRKFYWDIFDLCHVPKCLTLPNLFYKIISGYIVYSNFRRLVNKKYHLNLYIILRGLFNFLFIIIQYFYVTRVELFVCKHM